MADEIIEAAQAANADMAANEAAQAADAADGPEARETAAQMLKKAAEEHTKDRSAYGIYPVGYAPPAPSPEDIAQAQANERAYRRLEVLRVVQQSGCKPKDLVQLARAALAFVEG
jgi:hypothetical protein